MGMKQKSINNKKCFVWDDLEEKFIDDLALNMMEQNQIDTLLPFRVVHQKEGCYFRYELEDHDILVNWMEKVHSKKEVLQLLDSIVLATEETEKYLLEEDHLYMETAFVAVAQNRCRFAYIPLNNYQGIAALDLVTEILNQINYAKDEAYTYIFDLMNAIARGDVRNIAELKKWMKMLQSNGGVSLVEDEEEPFDDRTTMASTDTATPEPVLTFPVSKADQKEKKDVPPLFPAPKAEKKEKEKKEPKKSGFFSFGGRAKGKNALPVPPVEAVENVMAAKKTADVDVNRQEIQYVNQMSDDDSTVLIDDFQKSVLVRRSTGEEFVIEDGSYIIGSGGKKHVDILISGNPAISHVHAKIVRTDGVPRIEDLNSTNGTFVNGEELNGTGCALLEGMRITLANEEFTYEMRRM